MTNKDLNRLRNRPENLTREHSAPLLVIQDSSPECDAVLTSVKLSDPDNFLNLVDLLFRFLDLADNLEMYKRLIRNLYFEKYYFLSINCQVLLIKLPRFYTYK